VLTFVRAVHTIVWAFFATLILALPVLGAVGRFDVALIVVILVALEGVVLAVNGGRCPLTDVAARYTDAREANFDIYLPLWLATHNKTIFTALFLVGAAFVAWRWASS
jgi:hypothetical protein